MAAHPGPGHTPPGPAAHPAHGSPTSILTPRCHGRTQGSRGGSDSGARTPRKPGLGGVGFPGAGGRDGHWGKMRSVPADVESCRELHGQSRAVAYLGEGHGEVLPQAVRLSPGSGCPSSVGTGVRSRRALGTPGRGGCGAGAGTAGAHGSAKSWPRKGRQGLSAGSTRRVGGL